MQSKHAEWSFVLWRIFPSNVTITDVMHNFLRRKPANRVYLSEQRVVLFTSGSRTCSSKVSGFPLFLVGPTCLSLASPRSIITWTLNIWWTIFSRCIRSVSFPDAPSLSPSCRSRKRARWGIWPVLRCLANEIRSKGRQQKNIKNWKIRVAGYHWRPNALIHASLIQ